MGHPADEWREYRGHPPSTHHSLLVAVVVVDYEVVHIRSFGAGCWVYRSVGAKAPCVAEHNLPSLANNVFCRCYLAWFYTHFFGGGGGDCGGGILAGGGGGTYEKCIFGIPLGAKARFCVEALRHG
jgi:hypothetical protein